MSSHLLPLVLIAGLLVAGSASAADRSQQASGPGRSQVERGRYLTAAANCKSCHTREGGAPYAGGVPFKTPLGTIYSPNITPDRKTGIGAWRRADFQRALHRGIGRGGEQLYPAFPYTDYTHMSRADVRAIRAYLATRRPVRYTPPANDMTFPFGYRPLIRAWKWVNFSPAPFDRAPPADGSTARGRYLVETLGHCGQCHTPRTFTQALDRDHALAGAQQAGWVAWNISNGADGIGGWSDVALKRYLKTGHAPGRAVAAGPMAEVIGDSTRHLSASDISAMVAYLRTVPGQPASDGQRRRPAKRTAEPAHDDALGSQLFRSHCASCHVTGGPGGSVLAFGRYSAVVRQSPTNLIQVLLNGVQHQTNRGPVFMPGYVHTLSDAQLAALANEVRRRYSANPAAIAPEDVERLRGTSH